MTIPILYSLRNCPFAMRARIALYKAKQVVELREVNLKNKPDEMLSASPKGTVPILVLAQPTIIDESLAIMLWAFQAHDPHNLLLKNSTKPNNHSNMMALIHLFDHEFKASLEQYKCAKRYHESDLTQRRQQCEKYITQLEARLSKHSFLMGDEESLADIAILPFIRQFARVERQWYLQSPYAHLRQWLNNYLQSVMFTKVMTKYPPWEKESNKLLFENNERTKNFSTKRQPKPTIK